jgi:hypothetical protein
LDYLETYDREKDGPLMMFLSPPAPHAPYTPEPKYKNDFSYARAIRTPSFNINVGAVSLSSHNISHISIYGVVCCGLDLRTMYV